MAGKKGDFGGMKIHPDDIMAKVFGDASMKPMQMAGKLWVYIHKHKNEITQNGQFITIKAGTPLAAIMGSGKIKAVGKGAKTAKKLWVYIDKHKLRK